MHFKCFIVLIHHLLMEFATESLVFGSKTNWSICFMCFVLFVNGMSRIFHFIIRLHRNARLWTGESNTADHSTFRGKWVRMEWCWAFCHCNWDIFHLLRKTIYVLNVKFVKLSLWFLIFKLTNKSNKQKENDYPKFQI